MSDAGGADALFDAIKAGEYERVKSMVTANPALIAARAQSGESAILTAVYYRQKEIANLLVARGAPLSIFEAAAAGEIERVDRLVEDDRSLATSFSHDGWTPLHLAAFFGHVKVGEFLIDRGADARAVSRNSNANTALHAALAGNHKILAALLIGAGADVNAGDSAGWRPLHLAAHNGILEVMKQLIAQGADVHVENNEGKTPLAFAQEKNHREAAEFLRRHGA